MNVSRKDVVDDLRLLIVGDVHCTANEIDDCEYLIDLCVETIRGGKVQMVVLLGDLHHNHAIVHVDVTAFWLRAIERLRDATGPDYHGLPKVVILLGNHDMANGAYRGSNGQDPPEAHALMPYSNIKYVKVIDEPETICGMDFVPYMQDEKAFRLATDNSLSPILFCHQTFEGSQYENGYPAADGFNIENTPHKQIVSGHIHAVQNIDKVWHPGAPRWRSLSDANTERHLYVMDVIDNKLVEVANVQTKNHCSEIKHIKLGPNDKIDGEDSPNTRYFIDMYGTKLQNDQREQEIRAKVPNLKLRRFDDAAEQIKVRESDGIEVAFSRYVANYKATRGTPATKLTEMASARM